MKKLLIPTSVAVVALLAIFILRLSSPQQAFGQSTTGKLNVVVLQQSALAPGMNSRNPDAMDSVGPIILDLNTGNVWHYTRQALGGTSKPTLIGKFVMP